MTRPATRLLRRRNGALLAAILLLALGGLACCLPKAPDQSAFAPLESLASNTNAVVRLYGAPIPNLRGMAVHLWFVLKPEGGTSFDRWEVWQTAEPPHGHVRHNLAHPEAGVGAGGTAVWAELTGPEADRLARFISEQSLAYPFRNRYTAYPGPNSNTYVQWMLNHANWDVPLPWTAIGKNHSAARQNPPRIEPPQVLP